MTTMAGVGTSRHRNPAVAGREAVESAMKSGGLKGASFVFMFATVGYDQQALVRAVRAATNGAALCGCSAEGTIANGEADESTFSIVVLIIESDELQFRNGVVTGLQADSHAVGTTVAGAVGEVRSDALALFLFPDGLTVNFDQLHAGLKEKLMVSHNLPMLGGAAADNWQFKQTYQYSDDNVVSDGVSWALMSGQRQLVSAVNHGCTPLGVEHTITASTANKIREIDGKPILSVLEEYLTREEMNDWGRVAVTIPFGFEVEGQMEEYDRYIIRSMFSRDEAAGTVVIQVNAPEGTRLRVMRRDQEKVANGIEFLLKSMERQLENKVPRLMFHFDCAGRGKLLLRDQVIAQLLQQMQTRFPGVPWIGFYTFGEIGPVAGQNFLHNYTAVLAAIA